MFRSFFLQPLIAHMTRSGPKYPLPPNIGFPFSYDLSKKQRSKNLSTSISSFWIRVTYCGVYMNLSLNIFEKSAARVQEFSQQWYQYFRLQVWKKILHSFLVYQSRPEVSCFFFLQISLSALFFNLSLAVIAFYILRKQKLIIFRQAQFKKTSFCLFVYWNYLLHSLSCKSIWKSVLHPPIWDII